MKLLQGLIWEEGYRAGDAARTGVSPTSPPAIRRWRTAGLRVAIYSSGSELAQRRLFASTPDGDLTPLLSRVLRHARRRQGREPRSYARIAAAIDVPPAAVLFVSDVTRGAGAPPARPAWHVALSVRPGNAPQPDAAAFDIVTTFDDLVI